MGVKIHIPANEVWSFFYKNKERCKEEMIEIAYNDETKYAVYLTEDDGYPMLSVCHGNDEPEYDEGAISKDDCTETAKRIFERYLFPVTVYNEKNVISQSNGSEYKVKADTQQEMEDEIYQREDELQLALCNFLQIVFENEDDDILNTYGEAIINEILDYFLEYLGAEHCFPIRRPTFVSDPETGAEFYTEYPYDPEIDEAISDAK